MFAKRFLFIPLFVLLAFVMAGCIPSLIAAEGSQPGAAYTQAVQTVVAAQTQTAGEVAVALLTQMAVSSPTPTAPAATPTQALPSPTPTATLPPTNTPVPPTPTPLPPTPTATATPLPCNAAQFVGDIAAPDGSVYGIGDAFTKTWRLKNVGSCSWDSDYSLVYRSGDQMNGAKDIQIGKAVKPGETIDLSIKLVAPATEGKYTGYWALKSDSGQIFGIGSGYDKAIWVQIVAKDDLKMYLDFAYDPCTAGWKSGSTTLGCPVVKDFTTGYVEVIKNPVLEGGYKDDEPALITVPNAGEGGYVQAKMIEFHVDAGDHFRAVIGCLDGAKNCNVEFKLEYSERGGAPQKLGSWKEIYDGKVNKIDIDLSHLEEKHISLILTVMSNNSNQDDLAFWMLPGVYR